MGLTTILRKKLLKNIAKASRVMISSISTAEMNTIKVPLSWIMDHHTGSLGIPEEDDGEQQTVYL